MQAIQCSKGHYYDPSQGQCPTCAAEASGTGFKTIPIESIFSSVQEISKTVPSTQPAPDRSDNYPAGNTAPSSADGSTAGGWVVDDTGPTQASAFGGIGGFDPIVGWLVCVSGPNRGRDYRLHSGTNFIGSSKEMDVCIENDKTVSHYRAASISYDDRAKAFFIQKGEGRNLIYLNDRAVRSDADLTIYDRITIGSTDLLFVPLCCDKFNWQD